MDSEAKNDNKIILNGAPLLPIINRAAARPFNDSAAAGPEISCHVAAKPFVSENHGD